MSGKQINLLKLAFFCAALIASLFAGYEFVERRRLLGVVDMETIHALHNVIGIGSSLVIAVFIIFYLLRHTSALLPVTDKPEILDSSDITAGRGRLIQHAKWFIQMRWIAAGASLIGVIMSSVFNLLPSKTFFPLLSCSIALIVVNIYFSVKADGVEEPYKFIMFQIMADLAVLTGFVGFSGGLENPLYLLYLLHVILAGALLNRHDALIVTLAAFAFLCVVAVGQLLGVLPHHTISIFPHPYGHEEKEILHASYEPTFVFAKLLTLLLLMLVTVYFVTLLIDRLRKYERLLVRSARHALAEVEKRKQIESQIIQTSKLSAIGELAGRIAHEINNPMGIVTGKLKLLLSSFDAASVPEKCIDDLRVIARHTERIQRISKGLLSYSRPSREKKDDVDVNYLVRSALALVDTAAIEGRIKIALKLNEGKLLVKGNYDELQQAVLNIINNAIESIHADGEIIVSTFSETGMAAISVSDTGIGIPPDKMDRIFVPFVSTKPSGKGTGLGLAICDGIVRSHNGKIVVESREGTGSQFKVLLPKIEGEVA